MAIAKGSFAYFSYRQIRECMAILTNNLKVFCTFSYRQSATFNQSMCFAHNNIGIGKLENGSTISHHQNIFWIAIWYIIIMWYNDNYCTYTIAIQKVSVYSHMLVCHTINTHTWGEFRYMCIYYCMINKHVTVHSPAAVVNSNNGSHDY